MSQKHERDIYFCLNKYLHLPIFYNPPLDIFHSNVSISMIYHQPFVQYNTMSLRTWHRRMWSMAQVYWGLDKRGPYIILLSTCSHWRNITTKYQGCTISLNYMQYWINYWYIIADMLKLISMIYSIWKIEMWNVGSVFTNHINKNIVDSNNSSNCHNELFEFEVRYLYIPKRTVTSTEPLTWAYFTVCISSKLTRHKTHFRFTKGNPYLTLTGELWGAWRFGGNWPRYNSTTLYISVFSYDQCSLALLISVLSR